MVPRWVPMALPDRSSAVAMSELRHDDGLDALGVGVGEVHDLQALVGDGDAGHDHVALAVLGGQQGGVKVHVVDLQLQAELLGDAPATSMSMPSKSPVSVVISYGGKAALVDIVSLPALTVVSAAASAEAASSVETASEDAASEEAASLETVSVEAEPPQAARLSIIAELSIRAVIFS